MGRWETMMHTYEAAPAVALLATHCALCGRPLLDAPSVECGMGPICRAKALQGAPEAHRAEVNALVARIAAVPDAATVMADVAAISAYGYATLAARLVERLAEERTVSVEVTPEGYVVRAPFSEAFCTALGRLCWGRRWDREGKVWRVPATARKGLWDALREAFPDAPLLVNGKVLHIA